jgi:hypothetical protein
MINKTEQIISKSEIEQFRTTLEFIQWVDLKLKLFKKYRRQIKEQELLRKGISKQFWGEVYPLYLLLKKQTLIEGQFQVKNIIGSQSYDAEIKYSDNKTHLINRLEFTEAKDGHDLHLRMKQFIDIGTVSLTGKLTHSGTEKSGHEIFISEDLTRRQDSMVNQYNLVRKCILNKKDKNPPGTALVVVIDDYTAPRYDNEKDLNSFSGFLNTDDIFKNTGFAALFFVGISGGLFFEKL